MAKTDEFCNRAEAYEAHDNLPLSPPSGDTIGDVILRRYSRREVLRGTLGVAAAAALFGPTLLAERPAAEEAPDRFAFEEIDAGVDETHHVAQGYQAEILLRWGDPLFPDSPPFDPLQQSAAAQLRQFGYNNDYIAFITIDDQGHAACCASITNTPTRRSCFPASPRQDLICFPDMTAELVDIEMAAHGVTIVEIVREGDRWRPVLDSTYNRRISPTDTDDERRRPGCRTRSDEDQRRSIGHEHPRHAQQLRRRADAVGHLSHRGGNFHGYFWSDLCATDGKAPAELGGDQAKSYARYGVPGCGRPGASSSTASMSTRSPTSRTGSAGSSRSILSIRSPLR